MKAEVLIEISSDSECENISEISSAVPDKIELEVGPKIILPRKGVKGKEVFTPPPSTLCPPPINPDYVLSSIRPSDLNDEPLIFLGSLDTTILSSRNITFDRLSEFTELDVNTFVKITAKKGRKPTINDTAILSGNLELRCTFSSFEGLPLAPPKSGAKISRDPPEDPPAYDLDVEVGRLPSQISDVLVPLIIHSSLDELQLVSALMKEDPSVTYFLLGCTCSVDHNRLQMYIAMGKDSLSYLPIGSTIPITLNIFLVREKLYIHRNQKGYNNWLPGCSNGSRKRLNVTDTKNSSKLSKSVSKSKAFKKRVINDEVADKVTELLVNSIHKILKMLGYMKTERAIVRSEEICTQDMTEDGCSSYALDRPKRQFPDTKNTNFEYPNYLLKVSLKPHQLEAVEWMTRKENGDNNDQPSSNNLSDECTPSREWDTWRKSDEMSASNSCNTKEGETPVLIYTGKVEPVVTLVPPSNRSLSKGGLLADEMGLGKTIMMCALIAFRHTESGRERKSNPTKTVSRKDDTEVKDHEGRLITNATIIVLPKSILSQWEDEIKSIIKEEAFSSPYLHYGEGRATAVSDIVRIGNEKLIVLTTYHTIISDSFLFDRVHWQRIVLDECHVIKSRNSLISRVVISNLHATYRWALSGSPVLNSINEIFPIVKFLRISPWSSRKYFEKNIINLLYGVPSSSKEKALGRRTGKEALNCQEQRALGRANIRSMLSSFMLRRTKNCRTSDGSVAVDIPPLEERIISCELRSEERSFYIALFKRCRLRFDRYVEMDAKNRYIKFVSLILRLRQALCHPLICDVSVVPPGIIPRISKNKPVKSEGVTEGGGFRIDEEISTTQVLNGENDPSGNKHPINEDDREDISYILNEYISRTTLSREKQCNRKFTSVTECETRGQTCCEVFDLTDSKDQKSIIEGTANTNPREELGQKKGYQTEKNLGALHTGQYFKIPLSLKFKHVIKRVIRDTHKMRDVVVFSQWTTCLYLLSHCLDICSVHNRLYVGADSREKRDETVAWFKGEICCDMSDEIRGGNLIADSLKSEIKSTDNGSYPIDIDSSLDIDISTDEEFQNRGGHQRNLPFRTRGKALLISLMAGGSGLNLVNATRIYLMDMWWNTGIEKQAIMRVHRIGQTRKVIVYRLIVKDSMDDKLLHLQSLKDRRTRFISNFVYGNCDQETSESHSLGDGFDLMGEEASIDTENTVTTENDEEYDLESGKLCMDDLRRLFVPSEDCM